MGGLRAPVAIGIIAGALALVTARACVRGARAPALGPRVSAPTVLAGRATSFTLHPDASLVTVRTVDGAFAKDLALSLVVDGAPRPLELGRDELVVESGERGALFHVDFEGGRAEAVMSFRIDRPSEALVATLGVTTTITSPETFGDHSLGLRVEVPTEGRTAFVSGIGELSDLGTVTGNIVTLDADARTLGVVSSRGSLEVSAVADEPDGTSGTPMRIAISSPERKLDPGQRASTDLRLVLADSSMHAWGLLHQLAGDVTARVTGVVTGTSERASVFGLDAEGAPRVLALAGEDGRFTLDVPKTVVQWYAAIDAARTSAPTTFPPGTPWDLRLDVSPGGELRAHLTDPDTGKPLTARLLVHGIDGTLDPSFGPDYRASGAGPIIDALRGDVTTPLPVGRYRVSATKGIEWSIDAKVIEIQAGRTASVDLAPRHVVPTPGVVGCDLHVHARPSFDAPVLPEDRVLSLVAAGVDFAVPSEHNIVGDYGPMLQTLDLTRDLAYVTGVEITTYNPRFGHFGLFPYPITKKVPPYRGTTPGALFTAARRGDPSRILQVNHPRLPKSIGYFEVFKFDPNAPRPPPGMRLDFDSMEVYNGYDIGKPERVDAVMRDYFALLDQGHRYIATGSSDSHRIQYQWAGYPRTMVLVGESGSGDKGPVDPQAVISSLKKGHAVVTSGPILELEVLEAHPGDEIVTTEDPIPLHLRVRAAPWVDVTSIELISSGKILRTIAVPSQATKFGAEPGTLAEAQARSVRFDEDLTVALGPDNTWLVAIARGTRRLDDALPFMPVSPMGFTNPVWITRDKSKLIVARPMATQTPHTHTGP